MKFWMMVLSGPLGIALGTALMLYLNRPVLPCPTMVAMSSTCLPFGCAKTYINERGEDTGECR